MAKRECSHHGCHVLVSSGSRCPKHKTQNDRGRYKTYQAERMKDPYEVKRQAFYNSMAWKDKRHQALVRDYGLCQHCKQHNMMIHADIVDHIIELRDDWTLRLQLSNLESLCNSCHAKKTVRERRERAKRPEQDKPMSLSDFYSDYK